MERVRQPIVTLSCTAWLLCSLVLATPSAALAWGQEGHRMVSALADTLLEPPAREAIDELTEGAGLVAIATWADEIRPARPETGPWHYVNIPRNAKRYNPARHCANPKPGDCVVEAITRFRQQLVNPSLSRDRREEALKFVVHLVADVHQPLHCLSDFKGGNTLLVTFFGEDINPHAEQPWNLHAVWDAGLLQRVGTTPQQFARTWAARLTPSSRTAWQRGTPTTWAWESHQTAVQTMLGLPDHRRLGPGYLRQSWPIAEAQMVKAAVRLAFMLNDIFAKPRP
ncbi:MAG: S1/P1 nuclease [Nitrospirales bacterium]